MSQLEVPLSVTVKLASIARLLEVTQTVSEHGYDWSKIDKLLFAEDTQEWMCRMDAAGLLPSRTYVKEVA